MKEALNWPTEEFYAQWYRKVDEKSNSVSVNELDWWIIALVLHVHAMV